MGHLRNPRTLSARLPVRPKIGTLKAKRLGFRVEGVSTQWHGL